MLLVVLPETAAVLQVSYGRDRFRIPSDMRLDNASFTTEPPLKRQKLSEQHPSVGPDSGVDPVLWRVCYEEFNRSFRWALQLRLCSKEHCLLHSCSAQMQMLQARCLHCNDQSGQR